ncbi:hypothetical protein L208DRAFT_1264013, partial [Tricholoma matsutake]
SEGTHHGCGHYVVTRTLEKHDCGNRFCTLSQSHLRDCPHCPNCTRYAGPDIAERTVVDTRTWCPQCEYWYNGAGAKRRS